MKINYSKAYVQVLEVLKYMPKEDVDKIPQKVLNMFENKKDIEYNFVINENTDFRNLVLLDETKAILTNLYLDYCLSEGEKNRIIQIQCTVKNNIEEEKLEKYNPDNLFFKKENITQVKMDESNITNSIIKREKDNFFKNILYIIKNKLHL